MQICGYQKLSMVDVPGKLAATIFTGGCNLRCPFCHNAPLVTGVAQQPDVPVQEVLDFLETRRGLLDAVCVSGGEPLLQNDVADFIRAVRDMGFFVKLDTNGTYPDQLANLLADGLVDSVAMDIKNRLEKYPLTVGLPQFDTRPVEESVNFLMHGSVPYEFRTTVVREFHQETDFSAIGRWLEGAPVYVLQNFVDSGHLIQSGLHGVTPEEMERFRAIAAPHFGSAELRGL